MHTSGAQIERTMHPPMFLCARSCIKVQILCTWQPKYTLNFEHCIFKRYATQYSAATICNNTTFVGLIGYIPKLIFLYA